MSDQKKRVRGSKRPEGDPGLEKLFRAADSDARKERVDHPLRFGVVQDDPERDLWKRIQGALANTRA